MKLISKLLIVCILALTSVGLMAKNDVNMKSFNKVLMNNIEEVVAQNPQIYETKPIGRAPASVKPKVDQDKLDEIQEQADSSQTDF